MREIKRLAQDQAHSLMQDYRLNTVTHKHTRTRTQTCAYVLPSTKLSNSCANACIPANADKNARMNLHGTRTHTSIPKRWKSSSHTYTK